MNELQKLKVDQLVLDNLFNGQEPQQEINFLKGYFNNNQDEINDFLKWDEEDTIYFKERLTRLLNLIKEGV